jgi:hypothetical protein
MSILQIVTYVAHKDNVFESFSRPRRHSPSSEPLALAYDALLPSELFEP